MTTVELIASVLGGGTMTAVGGAYAAHQATKRATAVQATKRATAAGDHEVDVAKVLADFVGDMREERARLIAEGEARAARLIAEGDAKRAQHSECLELVGELRGHVDQLEPRLQQMETALDECRESHARARTELDTFRRSVSSELAKRPPSNPGFPKVGGEKT